MGVSFFFQAEDGIRDGHVTGVQTCALPISGCQPNVHCTAALHRVSTECVLYCCTTPGVNRMYTVLLHYTGCQPNVYCTAALHRVSTKCVMYCCTTPGVN